jgi:hypothetical protein
MGGGMPEDSMQPTSGNPNWVGQDWKLNQSQNQNSKWQAQEWNTNQPQNQHGSWEALEWNMPRAQGNSGMDCFGQQFNDGSNTGFN